MNEDESNVYNACFKETLDEYNKFINDPTCNIVLKNPNAIHHVKLARCVAFFNRMKLTCTSSHLVDNSLDTNIPIESWIFTQNKVSSGYNSTKIQKIINIIKKSHRQNNILIYSSSGKVLNLIKDAIEHYSLSGNKTIIMFDKNIHHKKELETMRDNNLHTITLTNELEFKRESDIVIMCEPWWESYVEEILMGKHCYHRKHLTFYSIVMRDTIEESIMKICRSSKSNYDFSPKPRLPGFTIAILDEILNFNAIASRISLYDVCKRYIVSKVTCPEALELLKNEIPNEIYQEMFLAEETNYY
jgi:SNF2 family DNA or RNA helicase